MSQEQKACLSVRGWSVPSIERQSSSSYFESWLANYSLKIIIFCSERVCLRGTCTKSYDGLA